MDEKQFQAESQRLLALMIDSVYTNREIFLRELIANASDAIDKRAFLALTDGGAGVEEFAIELSIDQPARLLTIRDNGIGMSREELESKLGVIAASGSLEFREEHAGEGRENALIGQFGVGFYSAFMVADYVRVISRKHGEAAAWRWESDGKDGYTISPAEKAEVGTDVVLHIRPDGEEKDAFSQYLRAYPLYKLIKNMRTTSAFRSGCSCRARNAKRGRRRGTKRSCSTRP